MKAKLLFVLNQTEEAEKALNAALEEPTANMSKLHNLGRQLIAMGRADTAMKVFEMNKKKHPEDNFATIVGLARGYEATGKTKQAIKHYKMAAENAPEGQKEYYLGLAKNLE